MCSLTGIFWEAPHSFCSVLAISVSLEFFFTVVLYFDGFSARHSLTLFFAIELNECPMDAKYNLCQCCKKCSRKSYKNCVG